jgi:hypothetical protein
MNKVLFLVLLAIPLAACGNSKETSEAGSGEIVEQGPSLEEQEIARQKRVQVICITSAMATISGMPRDNYSLLSRVNKADITKCPGDFASAFVELRQTFSTANIFDQELASHRREGESAVGAGVAVSFAEWLFDTNTGVTPFSDWVERDANLKDRANLLSQTLRSQYNRLEQLAAQYGVDLNGGGTGKTVLLTRGEDTQGNPIFAFVMVPNNRLPQYMEATRNGGTFHPEQFGEIVLQGSNDPTETDYQRMEREFGFRRNEMIDMN